MGDKDQFIISEELAEWIGLKKSELLSELILASIADDLPLETHHLYDHSLHKTLESYDALYEGHENEYRVRLYVKSFTGKTTFYQAIKGVLIRDQSGQGFVFVPILSYVTKYLTILEIMSQGLSLEGSIRQ